MTASELKEEFNLRYNNALEGAPGLDTFEISSYLTNAQEQYVKMNYEATVSSKESFESKEKSRRALNELVKNEKIESPIESSRGLVDSSLFYETNNDVMFIILDTIMLNTKLIPVTPITHDEFMLDYNNPYRKPSPRRAWRLDVSKEDLKNTVEIVSYGQPSYYNIRYVAYPQPIIIGNLETSEDIAGMGLTLQGKTEVSTCLLSEFTHRDIVNIAVENAVLDYRESNLANRVKLDSRV